MGIDWQKERERFPVCKKYSYFMHASQAPLSNEVYRAEKEILDSLYLEAQDSWKPMTQKVDQARVMLAELAGGLPQDWGFGYNTGYNMNLLALAVKNRSGVGDVVSCDAEFPSSTVPWAHQGFNVIKVKTTKNGVLEADDLFKKITNSTKAVVLSHVQFSSGFRMDLGILGKYLYDKNIPFIVNATQSLGVFPIHVEASHISALCCSAYKWIGAGFGSSILYTNSQWREEYTWPMASTMSYDDPNFSGTTDCPIEGTRFMELGAPPFIQILGIEASLKNILRLGIPSISERILYLISYLEKALHKKNQPFAFQFKDVNRCGIAFLNLECPAQQVQKLKEKGVFVNERKGKVRISVHYYNNIDDIDRLVSLI